MSGATIVYLYCDHPDCRGESPYSIDPTPGRPHGGDTLTEQRRDAASEGWRRGPAGTDFCPAHVNNRTVG